MPLLAERVRPPLLAAPRWLTTTCEFNTEAAERLHAVGATIDGTKSRVTRLEALTMGPGVAEESLRRFGSGRHWRSPFGIVRTKP
jgi:hypothetical protein